MGGPLDVIIVGGSLAGLATAIALKASPKIKSITILERYQEQDLQDGGAGLRIGSELIKFISYYTGASPEEYIGVATMGRMMRVDGSIASDYHINSYGTSWGQLSKIAMRHINDQGPKTTSIPCTYHFGCTVTSLSQLPSSQICLTCTSTTITTTSNSKSLSTDLVICADGMSSRLRSIFLPHLTRQYAGYITYRGTVSSLDVSHTTRKAFAVGTMIWNHDSMAVCFLVPSNTSDSSSSGDPPKLLLSWAFYHHLPSKTDLEDLMTDSTGVRHEFSLPRGKMRPDHVAHLQQLARDLWPTAYAEVVEKTSRPFVQVITDCHTAPENAFCNGQVLFVGDAVGGQRPHIAAATTQCVFHAEVTRRLVDGEIALEEWKRLTLGFSTWLNEKSRGLGEITMEVVREGQGVEEKRTAYLKEQEGRFVEIDQWVERGMGVDFASGVEL